MLALIRMDWTLSRGYFLRLIPLFLLWLSPLVATHQGPGVLLFSSFLFGTIFPFVTLFPFLAPTTIEPFLCALPVSRGQIVLARYVSALGTMVIGFLIPLALSGFGHLAGLETLPFSGDMAAGAGLQAVILASFLFLFLPFHFRFGGDRGLGYFGATGLVAVIILLVLFGWERIMAQALYLADRFLDGGFFALGGALGAMALGATSLALSMRVYGERVKERVAPLPRFIDEDL